MIQARACTSKAEVQQAFGLARSVFSPAAKPDQEAIKTYLWDAFPGAEPKHVFGLFDGTNLVGVVRLQLGYLFIGGRSELACNMTSIAVAEDYRGQGFSLLLMDEAMAYAQSLGARWAYLFARRAVDHYYTRFGFEGASSYDKVVCNLKGEKSGASLNLRAAVESDVSFLRTIHDQHYGQLEGSLKRSSEFWCYSLGRRITNSQLHIVVADGLGYAVVNEGEVVELAVPSDAALEFVSQLVAEGRLKSELTVHGPSALPAVQGLIAHASDVTVSWRRCTYGGHMIAPLCGQKRPASVSLNFPFLDQL